MGVRSKSIQVFVTPAFSLLSVAYKEDPAAR